MKKREFIKVSGLAALGLFCQTPAMKALTKNTAYALPEMADSSEAFWEEVRKGYDLPDAFINLENGYYCVQPLPVLHACERHMAALNREGAYYMRTRQLEDKKRIAEQLCSVAGCEPGTLMITRNTTEALDLVISGFPWKAGDEAVMADQDYGAMRDMFKQVAARHGIKLVSVSVPNHPKSDEELVALYEKAITPNTRLLMVSHVINITGQVLPVRKLADMAHAKGVQVMVDGAHAFAHIRFKLSDLNCDYYGCSLHKWLSAPLGAGFLYVRKDHIPELWPLMAESESVPKTDILALNHMGTIPAHIQLSIEDALGYNIKLGWERKEARLRFLQRYWTDKVRHLPDVILNTPAEEERTCAIANVGIRQYTPAALAEVLFKKYGIYTVAIDTPSVKGCRITPNVYTRLKELDALVTAITELAKGK